MQQRCYVVVLNFVHNYSHGCILDHLHLPSELQGDPHVEHIAIVTPKVIKVWMTVRRLQSLKQLSWHTRWLCKGPLDTTATCLWIGVVNLEKRPTLRTSLVWGRTIQISNWKSPASSEQCTVPVATYSFKGEFELILLSVLPYPVFPINLQALGYYLDCIIWLTKAQNIHLSITILLVPDPLSIDYLTRHFHADIKYLSYYGIWFWNV